MAFNPLAWLTSNGNGAEQPGPYATTAPFIGPADLPHWMPAADAHRIAAYQLYEQLYDNITDALELVRRGSNDNPVYLPAAKTIIEACHRFLAVDWGYQLDPRAGTEADRTRARTALDALFAREQIKTKFVTQKRWGLIRGDAIWHVRADPTKPPGRRLMVHEVDPGAYFPIFDDDDPDRLTGVHLVDQVEGEYGRTQIRRQTYRKVPQADGTVRVSTETAIFELTGWDDRTTAGKPHQDLKRVRTVQAQTLLPPSITALPVYHVRNTRRAGDPFGASELTGIERVIASVNQAVSDQELALALDGIGAYVTDSAPPTDEHGNETTWQLGPGRVVELKSGTFFNRVSGAAGQTGGLTDHARFLLGQGHQAAGIPDVAVGKVDVQVAQSGVALALELGPLLAKNAEKETEMLSTVDHMLFDLLHGWLPAYEGLDADDVVIASSVGDPMPENREAKVTELIRLAAAGLISGRTARQRLADLGYELPDDEGEQVAAETRAGDPFAARLAREAEQEGAA